MHISMRERVITKTLVVKRSGATITTVSASPLFPASPEAQQEYNIQSPRLGFTLFAVSGLNMQVGDQLTHTDGSTVSTLYVVGLATWSDAIEITAEMVK
jgi:hypothetical protein